MSVINWETLGDGIASEVTAVSWSAGRLDIFGRGTDNGIKHKYFEGKWFPSSATWESLGDVPGGANGNVSAVCWAEGRLDVFVRGGENVIYHKWFQLDWGPSVTGWESLGAIAGGATGDIAAVSWAEGRLDLFVHGVLGAPDHPAEAANAVYHKWFENEWGPSATDWESLGGSPYSGVKAVSWGKGRLDLFTTGDTTLYADYQLRHKWFDGEWQPSSTAWEILGRGFSITDTSRSIGAASWGEERLDLFFLDGENDLVAYMSVQGKWFPWWSNVGYWRGAGIGYVTAVSWGVDRVDLFVRGYDNVVYHEWFDGQTWQPAILDGQLPIPAIPSGLHVVNIHTEAGNGASSVDLTWTDKSNNEAGFKIRCT